MYWNTYLFGIWMMLMNNNQTTHLLQVDVYLWMSAMNQSREDKLKEIAWMASFMWLKHFAQTTIATSFQLNYTLLDDGCRNEGQCWEQFENQFSSMRSPTALPANYVNRFSREHQLNGNYNHMDLFLCHRMASQGKLAALKLFSIRAVFTWI